jgi:hypothetical protein
VASGMTQPCRPTSAVRFIHKRTIETFFGKEHKAEKKRTCNMCSIEIFGTNLTKCGWLSVGAGEVWSGEGTLVVARAASGFPCRSTYVRAYSVTASIHSTNQHKIPGLFRSPIILSRSDKATSLGYSHIKWWRLGEPSVFFIVFYPQPPFNVAVS